MVVDLPSDMAIAIICQAMFIGLGRELGFVQQGLLLFESTELIVLFLKTKRVVLCSKSLWGVFF